TRQQAAMIEVRVRQHHGVEGRGTERPGLPVALAQGLAALELSAIDEHLTACRRRQEVLGTGHRLCGAEKGEVGQRWLREDVAPTGAVGTRSYSILRAWCGRARGALDVCAAPLCGVDPTGGFD